jgi:NADPH2:quinone reductase
MAGAFGRAFGMSRFTAFRIFDEGGTIAGRIVEATLDELTPASATDSAAREVVIRAEYSSVNYKDALAATGTGKILRRVPLVGGIDVAGRVVTSADERFGEGDPVIVTGYDLGVAADGGYAEYVRVPSSWVVPLPDGLTLFEAMALGTAGFTAALAIHRLEHNGLRRGEGPVAVTGATGGVGSIATAALSRLGYAVTAITGKEHERDYVRALGASEIVSRPTLQRGTKPLERATWAAAVDAAGGELLAWLVRTTKPWGGVASTGLTGGTDLHLTVMPFILRGVSLIGVDSVACPMPLRRQVWQRLASDMKPPQLGAIAREIALADLPGAFATLLAGQARGRFVVRVA